MAKHTCYHCGVTSHQTRLIDPYRVEPGSDLGIPVQWTCPFRCNNCRLINIGSIPFSDRWFPTKMEVARSHMDKDQAALVWQPRNITIKGYTHVPEHIAAAAAEAHADHSIESYRSAVLMCRSVIEATAKHQGITDNINLMKKIEKMDVDKFIKEQAHEIRHLGNEMAHGDFIDPVDETESSEIIQLMDEVLERLYESPGRLEARKIARQNRGKAQTEPAQTQQAVRSGIDLLYEYEGGSRTRSHPPSSAGARRAPSSSASGAGDCQFVTPLNCENVLRGLLLSLNLTPIEVVGGREFEAPDVSGGPTSE